MNVVVKDAAGNESIYTSNSATTTSSVSRLILFSYSAANTATGNLGGRTGADTNCQWELPVACTSYRALLSVSSTDTIAAMPTNYSFPNNIPIKNAAETQTIASNWAGLTSGTILVSLFSAGVLPNSTEYWTGSTTTGGWDNTDAASNHCSGWTTSSGGPPPNGTVGISSATNGTWLNSTTSSCANVNKYHLHLLVGITNKEG